MAFIEDNPIRDGLDISDLVRMNIGRRWWHCTLANIPDGLLYREVVVKYIAKLADHVRNGRGLLFHGPLSTGKSGAAVIIAKAVVCHGGTAYFMPVSELSDHKIENKIFSEEEGITVWQRMQDVDLLALDDLGAEHTSQWVRSLIERIVRLRSNRRKAIVYTTNRFDELNDTYGESTIAIIKSTAFPVMVEGKDWRDDEIIDLKKEILGS